MRAIKKKKTGLEFKTCSAILGSMVNIIGGGGGVGSIWPFNEHKNLHLDNEQATWVP